MVVKGLITNVSTDAELKALTGMLNNEIVYHSGASSVFMYYQNDRQTDLLDVVPNLRAGVWKKERIKALTLEEYKAARYVEIDERTGELILQGFSYGGKVFSLSQNAQINILGLNQTRNDPALTYPIIYNTIDDLDNYSIVSPEELHTMYLTALGTKKAVVDSGSNLKEAIRTAASEAEVEQIIDNR